MTSMAEVMTDLWMSADRVQHTRDLRGYVTRDSGLHARDLVVGRRRDSNFKVASIPGGTGKPVRFAGESARRNCWRGAGELSSGNWNATVSQENDASPSKVSHICRDFDR